MPSLTRPGVYISESQFPSFTPSSPGSATGVLIGTHPRGPTVPTVLNSWNDFVTQYGGFSVSYPPSALALDVYAYFAAGGASALCIRAVASSGGPTTASVTLVDSSTNPGIATLKINADNPGLWGSSIFVDVIAGNLDISGVPQTFTLVVKLGGTSNNNVVERWENLTMVPAALGTSTPGSGLYGANNYAPDIINSVTAGSAYINVVDMASASVGIIKNPTLVSGVNLTGGTDGNNPSLTDTAIAMAQLDKYPDQPFLIHISGGQDATDIGNAITYAEGRSDCFVIADTPAGLSSAGAASFESTLAASSFCAVYAPWITIADPYAMTFGRTRLVPPGASVMGVYARTDKQRGVAKTPAGLQAFIPAALGVELPYTNADLSVLTQANVNPVQALPNSGVVVMGGRTLSNILITRYITVRRSLIYLRTQFIALTKFAIFEPNDWILWNSITAVLSQFLLSFWQSGGLSGASSSEAFYVLCDSSVNTPDQVVQGIVNVTVGVALERPAEFVVIQLGQSATSTRLTSV